MRNGAEMGGLSEFEITVTSLFMYSPVSLVSIRTLLLSPGPGPNLNLNLVVWPGLVWIHIVLSQIQTASAIVKVIRTQHHTGQCKE